MNKLSQSEIEFITQRLKEGKPLPDSYRYIIPFETKKEYERLYVNKCETLTSGPGLAANILSRKLSILR